jgi:hypothetical protein
LDLFKKGKVDILIGSVPVGTGVDGLQYVCNRMVVVSLPWTSADYEQLIGRLYRQGSAFDKVEVIIPQVVLAHNGEIWSWDKLRLHRIQYKKTLADAALDGVIPEGELASPETMLSARELCRGSRALSKTMCMSSNVPGCAFHCLPKTPAAFNAALAIFRS